MRIIVQIELHEPGHPGQLKRLPVCVQRNSPRLPAAPSGAGTTSAIELEPPSRFQLEVIHWPKAARKSRPASLLVEPAPCGSPEIFEEHEWSLPERAAAIQDR